MPDDADTTFRRYDWGGTMLRAYRRADGSVLCEGYASREGILEYVNRDGSIRRELVTRQAVEDTARTLPRASVTLEHPPEFVNPDNVQRYGVGDVDGQAVVEETAQGGFVRVSMAIRRRDALNDIESKRRRELSVGYDVTIDPTPGTDPRFGQYDARQVGRRVNHVALVEAGRAGDQVALRVDADDRFTVMNGWPASSGQGDQMNPKLVMLLAALGSERVDAVTDDGKAFDEAIALSKKLRADAGKYTDEYVEGLVKEKKEADKMAATAKADAEKMAGERDAFKAKLDEMMKTEQDRADAAALAELQGLAATVGVKHDGLALADLRLAVAKTRVDSLTADASPERVDGVLAVIRADASRTDGRVAGRRAWDAAASQTAQVTDAAEKKLTPTEVQLQRKDQAFKGRSGEAK